MFILKHIDVRDEGKRRCWVEVEDRLVDLVEISDFEPTHFN